ncbi:MAG: hypothetical protein ACLPX5_10880, partial [Dissulfurispiraceae bacterium]
VCFFLHIAISFLHRKRPPFRFAVVINSNWGSLSTSTFYKGIFLRAILYKNQSRIGISLSDSQFISTLKEEYEKSLSILLPLKEKLKRTDWLIDQIVYKLYGLTDQEIKIVEEKVKR